MIYITLIVSFVAIIVTLLVIVMFIESGITSFRGTAPELSSEHKLREAIAGEIYNHYSDAKTVIDVGSGMGGMAQYLGRKFVHMQVTGVELMPFVFSCAFIMNKLFGPHNVIFLRKNVINYLSDKKHFDIAVCYSGTKLMAQIEQFTKQFDVILSLDFPLPQARPKRKIKLHHDTLGQHYLYVYEK